MTLVLDFLEGAVDLHVHSAPDVDQRRFNDIESAREAVHVGMGVVFERCFVSTTAVPLLAGRRSPVQGKPAWCLWPTNGLKGPDTVAEGNALGQRAPMPVCPVRATRNQASRMPQCLHVMSADVIFSTTLCCPYRAKNVLDLEPGGVAPG